MTASPRLWYSRAPWPALVMVVAVVWWAVIMTAVGVSCLLKGRHA